jgi:hypothetical protein
MISNLSVVKIIICKLAKIVGKGDNKVKKKRSERRHLCSSGLIVIAF